MNVRMLSPLKSLSMPSLVLSRGLASTLLFLIIRSCHELKASLLSLNRDGNMMYDIEKIYGNADVVRARNMPKVELHLHLDGSLSPEFIARRAAVRNVSLPAPPSQLRQWLMEQKLLTLKKDDNKVTSGKNWPVFDFCNQFLQSEAELREATLDLLYRLADEGVVYAEIRFCPTLHTTEGLTEEEAIEAVAAGVRQQNRIKAGIILVALRSKTPEHAGRIAELARRYLQHSKEAPAGVVGMDVAGDEGTFPLSNSNDSMAFGVMEALRLGVPVTLHAGEWPEKFGSVANLEWAIRSGAKRIGHAITVRSEPSLINEMKQKNITVEVCLTSNVGNSFKVANFSVHPVRILYENRVAFSLSSDNLLLSGDASYAPSPTAETLRLVHDVGLGWGAAKQSVLHGLRAAFSPAVDDAFIKDLRLEDESN